jgi:hypothetical protein
MRDNFTERVQILSHAHIICITVLENRIICCQIFCDFLLECTFELIFKGYDRQSSVQNNRKLISLHNNGEDDTHAHGFAVKLKILPLPTNHPIK